MTKIKTKIEGMIWKLEEIENEFGLKRYHIMIETEKLPKINLGNCEVIQ